MPLCQGPPGASCPDSCSDSTVHYGIYDVFQCPACERVRDETEQCTKDASTALATNMVKSGKIKSTVRSTTRSQRQNKITGDSDSHGDDEEGNCASCPCCLMQLDGKRQIKCDVCFSHFHQKCTEMNAKVFDKFITSVGVTGWVCSDCKLSARSSFHRMESAIAQLTEELAVIKCEMNDIKRELTDIKSANVACTVRSWPIISDNKEDDDIEVAEAAKTTLIVHRTLHDTARRKRNIIITGLPESQTSDDRSEFLRMCEENLTIKPMVATNGCVRIGKQSPNVPRRLLVRLSSEEAAAAVLKDAPKLRSSVDQHVARNVYINPDLAPAAAKLAYEARKKRRELKRRQQNNDATNTTSLISQSANAPSNENNMLVVVTTDVPPPSNNNFGTNCQYRNDQGRLQAGACAPIVDIAANKNSFGSDLDPSRIAEATSGVPRPASLSSSSSSAGHNSSPADRTANGANTANSFRIDFPCKQ